MPLQDLIGGKQGESLFYRPLFPLTQPNELPSLFQKASGLADHRLLALVTAMLVEGRIDKILSAFMPRYKVLKDRNDCTQSFKIDILRALNLLPCDVVSAADCLRKVRNKFAHDLDKTSFSEISDKVIKGLKGCRRVDRLVEDPSNLEQVFDGVAFFCILGLNAYTPAVAELSERIRHLDFEVMLAAESEAVDRTMMEVLHRLKAGESAFVGKYGIHKASENTFQVFRVDTATVKPKL